MSMHLVVKNYTRCLETSPGTIRSALTSSTIKALKRVMDLEIMLPEMSRWSISNPQHSPRCVDFKPIIYSHLSNIRFLNTVVDLFVEPAIPGDEIT